jgi:hypothetical protein
MKFYTHKRIFKLSIVILMIVFWYIGINFEKFFRMAEKYIIKITKEDYHYEFLLLGKALLDSYKKNNRY